MSEDTRPDDKTLTRREMLTGTAALTVSVVVPGVVGADTPKLVSTIFGGPVREGVSQGDRGPLRTGARVSRWCSTTATPGNG